MMRQVKLCAVGNSGVGKSCLLIKFVHNEFSTEFTSTIAGTPLVKNITIGDFDIKFHIWDTCGQEKFRSIIPMFYRDAEVVFIVYDVTNTFSYDEVETWLFDVKENCNEKFILVLIGNKSDLEETRQVPYDCGEKLARKINALFYETSAKTGENIDALFEDVAMKIMETEPRVQGTIKTYKYDISKEKNTNKLSSKTIKPSVQTSKEGKKESRCC